MSPLLAAPFYDRPHASSRIALLLTAWAVVWLLLGAGLAFILQDDPPHPPRRLTTPPALRSFEQIYHDYSYREGFDHYFEYARAYDDNLSSLRSRILSQGGEVNMLEIGVQSGGSINVWTEFFDGKLRYTGIDINQRCARFTRPDLRRVVEIGSQSDPAFLTSVCRRHGPFDVVVDDGSHLTAHILTSLRHLWSCLNDKAVYAIEDLHSMTLFRGVKGMAVDGEDFYDVLGDIARNMSSYFTQMPRPLRRSFPPSDSFSGHIQEIRLYDSLAFFHYNSSTMPQTQRFKKGKKWFR